MFRSRPSIGLRIDKIRPRRLLNADFQLLAVKAGKFYRGHFARHAAFETGILDRLPDRLLDIRATTSIVTGRSTLITCRAGSLSRYSCPVFCNNGKNLGLEAVTFAQERRLARGPCRAALVLLIAMCEAARTGKRQPCGQLISIVVAGSRRCANGIFWHRQNELFGRITDSRRNSAQTFAASISITIPARMRTTRLSTESRVATASGCMFSRTVIFFPNPRRAIDGFSASLAAVSGWHAACQPASLERINA